MSETWKATLDPNFEVSDMGRLRRATNGRLTRAGRILAPTINSIGYRMARQQIDGKEKLVSLHRLIAIAFHGEPIPGQIVRHLDGDKLNNAASNLRWGTQAENVQDSIAHGTYRNANAEATHCKQGHELAGDNLSVTKSKDTKSGYRRHCAICMKGFRSKWADKQRTTNTIGQLT